jgi:hypothetical protein
VGTGLRRQRRRVIHATAVELHHETTEQATVRVRGIGDTLVRILHDAKHAGMTPAAAALDLARQRIQQATDRQPGVADTLVTVRSSCPEWQST